MNNGLELKYLETSIKTMPKEELTLKVFDALIMFSTQGVERIRTNPGDIEGIHNFLRRAQRACALLMGSLDFEVGGELSRNLFRVYEFWHHELVLANMRRQADRIERLIPDFKEYRKTWAEAIRRYRAEQQQAPAALREGGGYAVTV